MQRDEAIAILRRHEAELKQLGVAGLYLFGSTARNEAREDSDVDLFFDLEAGAPPLVLFDIMDAATRILGCRTDVLSRTALHRLIRPRVEQAAVRVF